MVLLADQPLSPDAALSAIEDPTLGGVSLFIGRVRSQTDHLVTTKLCYESYPEMAVSQMEDLARVAAEKWQAKVVLMHRVGELIPGEIAVITAAACAHRAEAFECCRFLIDSIKQDVPIWKREFGPDGSSWVEGEIRGSVAE